MKEYSIDYTVSPPCAAAGAFSELTQEYCEYDRVQRGWVSRQGYASSISFKINSQLNFPFIINVFYKPFDETSSRPGYIQYVMNEFRCQRFYPTGGDGLLSLTIDERYMKGSGNVFRLDFDPGQKCAVIQNIQLLEAIGYDTADWMQSLDDDTRIADINLPGTHDSVAYNADSHTPFACHYTSLPEQLALGVRLFDIRLKVKREAQTYTFATCHGNVPGGEYIMLSVALDQFKTFLARHYDEMLAVMLKVDDWNGNEKDKAGVLDALHKLVSRYGISYRGDYMTAPPKLADVRGKIYFINRLYGDISLTDARFGLPVAWDNNTPGAYARTAAAAPKVYVQDQYKGLSGKDEKCALVTAAFEKKRSGEYLLNFASATQYLILGLYINKPLLNYFGQTGGQTRPRALGWILLDYESEYIATTAGGINLVSLLIDSNFGYQRHWDIFSCLN